MVLALSSAIYSFSGGAVSDFNQNGNSDTYDLYLGALTDAQNKPTYRSAYYAGGYPPESEGVCTDVVWRAFRQAGFSLREMVHADILSDRSAYFAVSSPDKNIDFRRVRNLRIFFERHALSKSLDIYDFGQWQAGDIVIFGDNQHIGIVSAKTNEKGVHYILHNGGQKNREEDYLSKKYTRLTGHYRFDASLLPESLKIPFEK